MNPLKLKILLPLFLLLLFVTPALSHPQPQAAATVLRIIDGDTLEIELQGKKESVRLIGIDCPESKANQKAKKDAERSGQDLGTITAMGEEATAFTKSLIRMGNWVKIEFGVQQKDKYRGLLGYVYLPDGRMLNEEIVRAGKTVTVSHVRDLRGVIDWEKAEIGVLICMAEPTKPMKAEAASAGFYTAPWTNEKYPRLQILTIKELLGGKEISYPAHGANVSFRKAPKSGPEEQKQGALDLPLSKA